MNENKLKFEYNKKSYGWKQERKKFLVNDLYQAELDQPKMFMMGTTIKETDEGILVSTSDTELKSVLDKAYCKRMGIKKI
ncbi:MAG: hypothetical protein NT038_03560 [Euryarchaeota archaeon]|nr:hypothetical protein [Euryarchaeota archaeon]